MKSLKISFIFLYICIFNSYAQNVFLYDGIQQAKNSGEKFEAFSTLTPASKSVAQSKRIQEHFIDPQEVYLLHYSQSALRSFNASITLEIPFGSKNLQLELQEITMD